MPRQKRYKTDYPGVYYIEGTSVASGKEEKIYYIYYRKDGKQIEEKVGRQFQDDMRPARASAIRTSRINREQLSNQERRDAEKARIQEQEGRWTISRLWEDYMDDKPLSKSLKSDNYIFQLHLEPIFGEKIPEEIEFDEVKNFRKKISKTKSSQTVYYLLSLLVRIVNYGKKKKRIQGLNFEVEKPKVNNEKTEDLSSEQLNNLLNAIDQDSNIQAANILKLALYTGMRRGEMFNLMWDDIKWEREFILIRDPKGGKNEKIPLNDAARKLLEKHPRTESPYVFPGRGGKKRTDIRKQVNRIKDRAKLPKDFRAIHGLRHVYASILASSGQVDMYTLQKLLTHKSPQMTQRYAHLRDETLKKAANLAGEIIDQSINRMEKRSHQD